MRELGFLCKFFGGIAFVLYPVFRFFWCNARGGRLDLLPGMTVFALVFLVGLLLGRLAWENEQFANLSDQLERLKERMDELEGK
ncbi:MAG: hypothetical protein IKB79_01020 [Oscillospiraceae bacterium]|nr:hypothetical protein [Oscillospiraceae bacterium]